MGRWCAMAINESWLPIIAEGVTWVKEQFGPSKNDLKIQISDLENQVRMLAAGNTALINSLGLITQAVLRQLQSNGYNTVNADTIVFVGENDGSITATSKSENFGNSLSADVFPTTQEEGFNVAKIFDGIDQEIAQSRISRPSERR